MSDIESICAQESASAPVSKVSAGRVAVSTADIVVTIFNQTFAQSESTLLAFGGSEPVYYPAGCEENPGPFNKICFAHGFVNSALHEIAHWCIAGEARRRLVDYGYWYQADGRSNYQQQLFTRVEVKPQALEWHFARACRVKFYLSTDNLNSNPQESGDEIYGEFKQAVCAQARHYQQHGLPARATLFQQACTDYFTASSGAGEGQQQCQITDDFDADTL